LHTPKRLPNLHVAHSACCWCHTGGKELKIYYRLKQSTWITSPYHVNSRQCTSKTYHSESMCCKEIQRRCIITLLDTESVNLRNLYICKFLPVLFHPFTHFCNAKGSDFMPGISETKKECQLKIICMCNPINNQLKSHRFMFNHTLVNLMTNPTL